MTDDANQHQNTPSADDLEAQLAADEAVRNQPEPESTEVKADPEPEESQQQEAEHSEERERHETQDEFEKRLARMAFERRKAEKEAKELRQRIEQLEGKAPKPPADEEMRRLVAEEASKMADVKAYNDKANAIYQAGIQSFQDFGQKMTQMNELGLINRELVEAADETGEPAALLYYLSKNVDEAERIANMRPHQMGVALGKLAAKLTAPPPPKPQSKAPAPIKPVAGAATPNKDIMQMSLEEYMRQEDERMYRRRRGMA